MQNLNILAEYKRSSETPQSVTVEDAEAVIKFCGHYGTECIFLHKDGVISQYFRRVSINETICNS